jgi:hypothetical protein
MNSALLSISIKKIRKNIKPDIYNDTCNNEHIEQTRDENT